ncbi:PepSY domain-containing protein [Comamonas aquatica]|uniref:PepSY domain-containing protein n=1 Tax=Comamonas aquatica TaxID=225991 RepID=A0AA43AVC5_9BURK|nr:PepSY domain-containing protein [Comamonas aquatica]MDH1427728.1 PepSY domain-containing protein [Comamonas aquatica]MDH1604424.1 PepSY domain-containing protein [Comamonas aquatica]MDH1616685.1 PepSY domain-containing protein [Comamonas aquatica]MDH2004165.1 PepSY domain-containing protein [Comamonas aquatica]
MVTRSSLSRLRWPVLLGAFALGGALWLGAGLDLPQAHSDESDHELARQALQQGKVLPLRTVLDQVERQYQGQVLKVEFEHDNGRFIYEMRLLHPNGQLSKLKVDAVDGRVLSVRRKGQD